MFDHPDDVFVQLLRKATDPELLKCGAAVSAIAHFDIPEARQAPFLRFHRFITDPQPRYVTAWRSDETLERRWYHAHVNGILGDVRGALAAAHYHLENLAMLEDSVSQVLAGFNFADRMENTTMALGGTRKLDFEYQAFVLACRRTLDYLAGALGSYFRTESYSFRTLPRSIAKQRPAQVAAAISAAFDRHAGDLSFILADGRKSARNRIAHYEFVAAGVINLSRKGFVLRGGGEDLGLPGGGTEARLQDNLAARLDRLHLYIADMIDSFVNAAGAIEAE
ncbi:MAG: hypothetical protein ACTHJU_15020 [Sphingopyxis sp.]